MAISAWLYTLIPAAAAIIGATVAVNARPGPTLVSAIQHFAAGVVFAAAAGAVLLGERLTAVGAAGCVLILAGAIAVEIEPLFLRRAARAV